MELQACKACGCENFSQNPFKPSNCRNCQHDHCSAASISLGNNNVVVTPLEGALRGTGQIAVRRPPPLPPRPARFSVAIPYLVADDASSQYTTNPPAYQNRPPSITVNQEGTNGPSLDSTMSSSSSSSSVYLLSPSSDASLGITSPSVQQKHISIRDSRSKSEYSSKSNLPVKPLPLQPSKLQLREQIRESLVSSTSSLAESLSQGSVSTELATTSRRRSTYTMGDKAPSVEATPEGGSSPHSPAGLILTQSLRPNAASSLRPESHKELSRRDHIANEIRESEKFYVRNLTLLVETFLKPLYAGKRSVEVQDMEIMRLTDTTQQTRGTIKPFIKRDTAGTGPVPLITEEQINIIFSNIVEILNMNQVLLADLEERMKMWDDTTLIGDIFVQLVPYLKSYIVYARMNEKAQEVLMHLEAYKPFMEFVKSWERHSEVSSAGGLRSYLILPIQRIPRYELFLKDLVKSTAETHPDYVNLTKALEQVRIVNQKINESIKEAENRLKLLEIQRSLDSPVWGPSLPNLIEAHRVFVKEGPLTKVCRSKHIARWVFLFNDMLIYASESITSAVSFQRKFLFHKAFSLTSLRVDDLPDRETGTKILKNAFKIVSPNKSFILYASSSQVKEEWIKTLRMTINEWNNKRATLLNVNVSDPAFMVEAPVWIPDDEVMGCMLCRTVFSITKRRHHCRSCGKVICNDCSRKKMLLVNVDVSALCESVTLL